MYEYYNVEKRIYDNLIKAESIGSYFYKKVVNNYSYKEITEGE